MLKPENIALHSKRDFADMTKVKILRCEKKGNLHLLSTNNGLIAKYYFQFF